MQTREKSLRDEGPSTHDPWGAPAAAHYLGGINCQVRIRLTATSIVSSAVYKSIVRTHRQDLVGRDDRVGWFRRRDPQRTAGVAIPRIRHNIARGYIQVPELVYSGLA